MTTRWHLFDQFDYDLGIHEGETVSDAIRTLYEKSYVFDVDTMNEAIRCWKGRSVRVEGP